MTTYVLIACSKSKRFTPDESMIWTNSMKLTTWNRIWHNQTDIYLPDELYSGRSFRKQSEIVSKYEDVHLYIISAGAGLISLSSKIPSYDSTFSKGKGPRTSDWKNLPFGGLEKLKLKSQDKIITFAPPQYHRALLNDDHIDDIKSKLVVPSTSPLSRISGEVIQIHPRSKEILKIGSSDLNTEFLRIFLSEGIEGFRRIFIEAEKLPPKIKRSSISDDDLIQLISKLKEIKNFNSLVRYLRDDLLIKASVERISSARKQVQDKY